jgi:hypothetical protein
MTRIDARLAKLEAGARQNWRLLSRQPLDGLSDTELAHLVAGLDAELGQDIVQLIDRMPDATLEALASGDTSGLSPEERAACEATDRLYNEVRHGQP